MLATSAILQPKLTLETKNGGISSNAVMKSKKKKNHGNQNKK